MNRQQLVQFCEKVLNGEDESVERIKSSYTSIDIESLCLDMVNLEKILNNLSQHLFKNRGTKIPHVYAFLLFCINVHEYLSSEDWYSKDILVGVVADILYNIKFRPAILVERSYIGQILKWCMEYFLNI